MFVNLSNSENFILLDIEISHMAADVLVIQMTRELAAMIKTIKWPFSSTMKHINYLYYHDVESNIEIHCSVASNTFGTLNLNMEFQKKFTSPKIHNTYPTTT